MSKPIRKRSEVAAEFTWDLTDIFPSDEAWRAEYEALKPYAGAVAAYQGRLGESAEMLLAYFRLDDELNVRVGRLYGYANCKADEDTSNGFYLATYRRPIERVRRRRAHILSPECEALLANAGEMADSPDAIFGVFHNADLRFPAVTDGAGAEQPLTDATFVPLLQSGDRTLRRNAFETYYATLGGYRNTLAATLDAQFKQLRFFANARRYSSTLDAALFALFDIGMERLGLRCLNSFFEFYLPELFPGKLTVYIAAFAGLAALVGWVLLLCGKRAGVTVIFAVSVLPFFKSILIFLTSILALFSAADLGAQALAFAKDFVTFVTAGLPIVLMLFWKGRGY